MLIDRRAGWIGIIPVTYVVVSSSVVRFILYPLSTKSLKDKMHSSVLLYLHLLPLLPALAIGSGPHQLRDLYAYPKYQVQFLNDLPVSASDAKRIREVGVGSEIEWLDMRPGDRRLEDGTKRVRMLYHDLKEPILIRVENRRGWS